MRRQLLGSQTALANPEPVDPVEYRKQELARRLCFFLGTHEVDTYVSPNGYKLKKVTRCATCESGHTLKAVL
jgi:hypothetical protein